MSQASAESNGPFVELARQVAPALPGALAICYVAGFMIVKAHLSRIGVFDADLVKARYLSIGAIFVGVHAAFALLVLLRIPYLNERADDLRDRFQEPGAGNSPWSKFAALYTLLELATSSALVLLLCNALIAQEPSITLALVAVAYIFGVWLFFFAANSAAERWISRQTYYIKAILDVVLCVAVALYATQLVLVLAILLLPLLLGAFSSAEHVRHNKLGSRFTTSEASLLLIAGLYGISATATFGFFGYDHVRFALGGGYPQYVHLHLRSPEAPEIDMLVKTLPSSGPRQLQLLSDDADSLTLRIGAEDSGVSARVFRIDRELVATVTYLPRSSHASSSRSLQ